MSLQVTSGQEQSALTCRKVLSIGTAVIEKNLDALGTLVLA